MTETVYKPVKSVPGLECSRDGHFRYKGKPKKPIVCHTVTGRRATVRLHIMMQGKKMLTDIKRKGRYGEYWHKLVKPIKIEVESLNLDCLWERYKVTNLK